MNLKQIKVCPKSGIKIHEYTNNKTINKEKDLDINNYSLDDIYNLFNIKSYELNEDIIKSSKHIVLKTHPDKSKLDPKYFLFYSTAYKKLCSIYEYQNKFTNKSKYMQSYKDLNDTNDDIDRTVLDNLFNNNKPLRNSKNFNNWFNEKFEKYNNNNECDNGYGEWLKSDDGVIDTSHVSKSNIGHEFEKQKRLIRSLVEYKGYDGYVQNTIGTAIVTKQNNNFNSGNLFNDNLSYTDLRQAYEESVIPVTEDDYNNVLKFKNVNEYKNYRNNMNTLPLNSTETLQQLYHEQEKEDASTAYELAKQTENSIKKREEFFGEINQIAGIYNK